MLTPSAMCFIERPSDPHSITSAFPLPQPIERQHTSEIFLEIVSDDFPTLHGKILKP
jgi:hypothetical protein